MRGTTTYERPRISTYQYVSVRSGNNAESEWIKWRGDLLFFKRMRTTSTTIPFPFEEIRVMSVDVDEF